MGNRARVLRIGWSRERRKRAVPTSAGGLQPSSSHEPFLCFFTRIHENVTLASTVGCRYISGSAAQCQNEAEGDKIGMRPTMRMLNQIRHVRKTSTKRNERAWKILMMMMLMMMMLMVSSPPTLPAPPQSPCYGMHEKYLLRHATTSLCRGCLATLLYCVPHLSLHPCRAQPRYVPCAATFPKFTKTID